ncbi:MAG: EamA family transporter [Micromonosporaceae bacterium]|nr:EamA family transporter [Micromonosporaceae bacterium]
MSAIVFGALLGAAILHASWNAIAKAIPDPRVAAGLFGVVGLVGGAVGVVLLPLPEPAAWPFIAGSSVLQTGYLLLLVRAYRHGEFGQVYPLARGLPPMLVTVVSLGVLGERLTGGQLAGVAVVSVALTGLVFTRGGGRPRIGSGLGLAAATGVVIAAYTLVDGVGVRQAGQPLSYLAWLFLLESGLVLAVSVALAGRGSRRGSGPGSGREFGRAIRRSAPLGLLGSVLSLVAYAIVVWAQSRAPLPLVSALRETSLLFAAAIGTLVFREPFRVSRLVATAAVVAGIALLQTS